MQLRDEEDSGCGTLNERGDNFLTEGAGNQDVFDDAEEDEVPVLVEVPDCEGTVDGEKKRLRKKLAMRIVMAVLILVIRMVMRKRRKVCTVAVGELRPG